MLAKTLSIFACLLCASGAANAGHHHHFHHYGATYAYPVTFAAPVGYPVQQVVYQPAYVVPTATVSVIAAPVATVSYSSYYAPMVPVYSTSGYYLAPRPAYISAPITYGRLGRPRDVEVELKYRRDGGYKYEIDFV